jgi:hypothetical protein
MRFTRGVKGNLQIMSVMLSLLPWANYPLHIRVPSAADLALLQGYTRTQARYASLQSYARLGLGETRSGMHRS